MDIINKEKISSFQFFSWWKKNQLTIVFLLTLVAICYVNSLKNDFVSDDIYGIVNNENISELSSVFSNPLNLLRPLSYYLINKCFGLNPAPYRMLGILFHAGSVIALFLLVYLLMDKITATTAAAIFAVHPLLTESITWISSGYYPQYSFFILLALILFLFSFKNKKTYYFSVISFGLALLTSEKAVVFMPILFVLFALLEKSLKDWRKLIMYFSLGGTWVLVYVFAVPKRVSSLQAEFYQTPQNINPFYQIPIAIGSYLKLIFWPKALTLYHSEMVFSTTQYAFYLSVFVLFLSAIFYFYKKNRLVFFWLCFFILSLLPMLTPFGISWIVAERYIYLGSMAIFVLIAMCFKKLNGEGEIKPIFLALLVLIISCLSFRTIKRNQDWQTQDTLWLSMAETSPSSPQNHNNLGDLYSRRGDFEKAIQEFQWAIQLRPNYGDAYHNLASTYAQIQEYDLAIESYGQAIKFNPNLWQSYQGLASIYFEQEKFEEAAQLMEQAVSINPNNANLHLNLGIIYLEMEQQEKAQYEFQTAVQLDPEIEKLFIE